MSDVLTPQQSADVAGDPLATPGAPARRPRRIREIDFSRPTKLSPLEQTRFEQAHAAFCRSMSLRLSTELRTSIEFEVVNSAQLTWAAALRDVPQPSILAVAASGPPKRRRGDESPEAQPAQPIAETSFLISVEQPLLFRMIERLIGGSNTDTPIDRGLTEIETGLARRIFGSLLTQLSTVWQELLGVSLRLVDIESQNVSVELAAPSDPTLVLTMVAHDRAGSATVSLLVPYASIAAATKRLSGKSGENDESRQPGDESVEAMRSAMGGVDVELRAEVGAVSLTIGEVLALSVGDVLKIGPAGHEGVFLGDKRLNRARPGRSGSRRAVQIVDQFEDLK
ncbi:MAG TPA: FliM/FliN family flagellar motor switch protein [Gaiellaceae bacterium]|nr:FliM/FliN family flagellar motor switch protein [Gaiellaceae bacterium]